MFKVGSNIWAKSHNSLLLFKFESQFRWLLCIRCRTQDSCVRTTVAPHHATWIIESNVIGYRNPGQTWRLRNNWGSMDERWWRLSTEFVLSKLVSLSVGTCCRLSVGGFCLQGPWKVYTEQYSECCSIAIWVLRNIYKTFWNVQYSTANICKSFQTEGIFAIS